MNARRIPVIHAIAVYDGQHYLGDVAELGSGQFAAFDTHGKRIAVFDEREDSERVILSRRRVDPGGVAL